MRNILTIEGVVSGRMTVNTTIMIDPTPCQIARFRNTTVDGQLRGTACGGHAYVYPAYDATHQAIREILKLPTLSEDGTDFWIIAEEDEPFSSDWPSGDDCPARNGMRLIVGLRDDDPAMTYLHDWFGKEPALLVLKCP